MSRHVSSSSPSFARAVSGFMVPPLFWMTSPTGALTFTAPEWGQFTGQTAFPPGVNWLDRFVHAGDRVSTRHAWRQALTMQQPLCIEHRLRGADGRYRVFLSQATPDLAPDGAVQGWRGVSTDLTAFRATLTPTMPPIASDLDAVLEAMTDAVFVYDSQGTLIQTNVAARALNPALAEPTYREQPFAERILPFAVQDARGVPITPTETPVSRILRGERLVGVDTRFHQEDGAVRQLSTGGAPLRSADGTMMGAVVVIRDVSERYQFEQAAAVQAAELTAIFEAINDGIFVYHLDGTLRRTNAAARRIFGLEADPAYEQRPFTERRDLLEPRAVDGTPFPNERWGTPYVLAGGTVQSDEGPDMLLRRRDGQDILLNSSGGPIRDAQGQQIGAVAVCRDVTARRALEQRTQATLADLLVLAEAVVTPAPDNDPRALARHLATVVQSVVDCTQVSIATIESTTQVMRPLALVGVTSQQEQQWWNGWRPGMTVSARLGAEVGEQLLRGETVLLDATQPPHRERLAALGARTLLIVPAVMGDQVIGALALQYTRAPLTSEDEHQAQAVARLVGLVIERERLVQERETARAQVLALQAVQEQMNVFLSVASHELRTPLTSLKATLQLAERSLRRFVQSQPSAEDLLERPVTLLGRTGRQITRMNLLVDDLLDVSRIQTGSLMVERGLCDLVAIVQEAVEEQQAAWPDRIVEVQTEEASLLVEADAGRISQVVVNYLTNALKYSPDTTPVVVQLQRRPGAVFVGVRDFGPGLDAAEHDRVWERFHRAPGIEVRSGSGVGLGLGLHIVRTIIEQHGGQVGIDSTPGHGALFWLTLPT